MPTRQEHLAQAEHNEALSQRLEITRYTDWAVTALFYSALHLIDAYLLALGMDPKDHAERLRQVASAAALRPVWLRYRNLLDWSIDARYECLPFTTGQVQALRRNSFEPLERHLKTLLGV